jgi:UDP:flavonoid glycosyltransferase YjiC (YdhE family)
MEAIGKWGGRAVLDSGWGGLMTENLPPNLFAVKGLPHRALFEYVSGVVHHGGAGTTASGLLSGAPTFITPIVADQAFWGERVAAIGAGPMPIGLKELNANGLAEALRDLTTNPSYKSAALEASRRLAEEKGMEAAAEFIERPMRKDLVPARSQLENGRASATSLG